MVWCVPYHGTKADLNAERLLHTKLTCIITTQWVGNHVVYMCEVAVDSSSVHQADNKLPVMRLQSL